MFGQTETAGIVCLYRVPESVNHDVDVLPIGHPIANTKIYVLDEEQRPCAVGVAGELYIGGAGVGRGYLNRPDLTAQKFVQDPFNEQEGARLYRTGDWARCNADGQIEFAGRRDQMVKLRGFRLELGEVEAALAKHPSIRESVVIARDGGAEKRLLAYFVANGTKLKVAELRSFLSGHLPDYAVPSAFVQMDKLPLSANGKVDRLALPEPDDARSGLSSEFVAPQNEIEKRLASIWGNVLRVERVGRDDNFFEFGGHSLLAAQIIARVRHEFGVDLSLRVLFEDPTVARMARGLITAGVSLTDLASRSIEPFARNGKAPLSFTQQQFWLLEQSEPNSGAYNVCTAINVKGHLDPGNLRLALNAMVDRHEILRTNIVVNGDNPVQVIAGTMNIALDISDLRSLPESERGAEIQRVLSAEAQEPFNLSHGPLLRTRLMKLGEDEHLLILTIHHIICDGWSVRVLLRELFTLYESSSNGRSSSLPRLAIQFADFALWQRTRLQGTALESSLLYWKQQLAGASPKLDLPTDYPRPERATLNGAQRSIHLPADISKAIRALSQKQGTTLFMTLLAAFQTLLFRYSGQEDIVVGSPVAGRTMLETEGLIGAFVNTLVLRGQLSGNPTFCEFLGRVRETSLGAFSHQDLPFEKLVQELNPERSSNHSPLFQVMFALQNSPTSDMRVEGLSLTPLKLNSMTSKFDLSLEVEEDPNGLSFSCEYNADLFVPATIERMLRHFQNLLEAIVANPTQRVAELRLLAEPERHQLLVEWNKTGGNVSSVPTCIHQLFEAQVERTPSAIAAEFQGHQLTYDELNTRANRLAHYLQKQGVGPEVMVGVCIERSLEMLVAILGVLKAGGAYVPLDPTYPGDRLSFMIEDAELSLVLTRQHLTKDLPSSSARLVSLDDDWEIVAQEIDKNPVTEVTAQNLAYVIYTSGSTGNPKGVMIEHRSLVSFTAAAAAEYEIGPGDRVLQFASLCFDLSAEEIYPALTHGATVVLRTDGMISSARDFLRYCDEWQLTVLDLPTAYWHDLSLALGEEEGLTFPSSVRLVIIGGEKASLDRVVAWQKAVSQTVRLVNTYGPTEATVVATMYGLGQLSEDVVLNDVPIGRPIRNATVFVLDEMRQPVPIGVAGELYIGGMGVARGYVKRPELTAERFISNPFSYSTNERLYRTGDLVRYLPDGNIEFLGRVDNQIKIRGFRVELEEIEHALCSHANVTNAVVVLHEDSDGDKRLVAYLVTNPDSRPEVSELRAFLKGKLPSYMVPATFEMIEALPLMPNGKIDRRALPDPQPQRREMDEGFVAPRTPIEQLLADVWTNVLKLEQIGIHDNFFELGGHSLLAARVVSNVRNSLEVELCMVDVFQAPTIASLAALLYPRRVQGESEDELAALLEELTGLTDEKAQEHFDREVQINDPVAA
jgi:amino acid adenylation domain-containing protein